MIPLSPALAHHEKRREQAPLWQETHASADRLIIQCERRRCIHAAGECTLTLRRSISTVPTLRKSKRSNSEERILASTHRAPLRRSLRPVAATLRSVLARPAPLFPAEGRCARSRAFAEFGLDFLGSGAAGPVLVSPREW